MELERIGSIIIRGTQFWIQWAAQLGKAAFSLGIHGMKDTEPAWRVSTDHLATPPLLNLVWVLASFVPVLLIVESFL